MLSILVFVIGMFWEASLDILAVARDYDQSLWKGWFSKSRFGDDFWNHEIAWKNKWKNGDPSLGGKFPGSSSLFVFVVDGWHLVKLFWVLHVVFAVVFYHSIAGYLWIDALLFLIVYGIGHELWRFLLIAKKG